MFPKSDIQNIYDLIDDYQNNKATYEDSLHGLSKKGLQEKRILIIQIIRDLTDAICNGLKSGKCSDYSNKITILRKIKSDIEQRAEEEM